MFEKPKPISAKDAVEKAITAGNKQTLSQYGTKGAAVTNARRRAKVQDMLDVALERGDHLLPDDELPKDLRDKLGPYRNE